MQQNMPYRHHGGGAYVPNQNQYGSTMNQDLYRSHHPGYAGNNNRNIPSKSWTENNSGDLMPPYGQVSPHSQMMSNPTQMPVTAMRSPPHAASSMNQAQPQGQQHFRPMQSPANSPHSWSQAQIPSPSMMHSSRTSPLPAHVRSPGQNQPFSPPPAHSMSLQPHQTSQENGQISQSMNSTTSNDNHNPSNPLHSLQKMVLLDQDSKTLMNLPSDGSEQFPTQCGSHAYVSEESTNEPKDSQYSTYYNMDENRFESKPNNPVNDASVFTPVQQMTNCNFPVPSHPVSNESDIKNIARVPGSINPSIEDFHSNPNQNSLPPQLSNSSLEQLQCKSNIPQNDCSLNQNECPPHAESAPVFTDQTKAAVSTNSEQALESKSNSNWVPDVSDPEKASIAQVSFSDSAGTPRSSMSQERCASPESLSSSSLNHENSQKELDTSVVNNKSSCKDHDNYALKNDKDLELETNSERHPEISNPSTSTPSSESQDCDSNTTSSDSKSSSSFEDSTGSGMKLTLRHREGTSYDDVPMPETENKNNSQLESWNSKASGKENKSPVKLSPTSNQKEKESNSPPRNPVKVVIHRIRKSDADDTWHVPGTSSKSNETVNKNEGSSANKVPESKSPNNTGPQIIMLSEAVSEKCESQNSNASNSVSSADDNHPFEKEDANSTVTVKKEPVDTSHGAISNVDKKRGRPVGSKNKMKSSGGVKSKRGKKGAKKRKIDNSKQKVTEIAPKNKKSKNFNGPYVHIIGSKENPSSVSVVNVAQKEDDKLAKTLTKRNFSSAVSRIKNKTVGHLSTLSPTYDAYNRDKTWVCVFCQKGSHHGGLGDLYGPYYIKDNSEEKSSPSGNSAGTSAPRNKRRKSETDDSKTPKRAKQVK